MVKFSFSRKKILIVAGVIVLLAAAAGAGILLRWLQEPKAQPVAESKDKLPASVRTVNSLIASGKTDVAQNKIDESIKTSTNSKETYMLYMAKAGLASSKLDYQAALSALLKAEEADPTFDVTGQLGNTYRELGNTEKAIEYFKKAIERHLPNDALYERDIEALKDEIRELGGQP